MGKLQEELLARLKTSGFGGSDQGGEAPAQNPLAGYVPAENTINAPQGTDLGPFKAPPYGDEFPSEPKVPNGASTPVKSVSGSTLLRQVANQETVATQGTQEGAQEAQGSEQPAGESAQPGADQATQPAGSNQAGQPAQQVTPQQTVEQNPLGNQPSEAQQIDPADGAVGDYERQASEPIGSANQEKSMIDLLLEQNQRLQEQIRSSQQLAHDWQEQLQAAQAQARPAADEPSPRTALAQRMHDVTLELMKELSGDDLELAQAIHDAAAHLGATCPTEEKAARSVTAAIKLDGVAEAEAKIAQLAGAASRLDELMRGIDARIEKVHELDRLIADRQLQMEKIASQPEPNPLRNERGSLLVPDQAPGSTLLSQFA